RLPPPGNPESQDDQDRCYRPPRFQHPFQPPPGRDRPRPDGKRTDCGAQRRSSALRPVSTAKSSSPSSRNSIWWTLAGLSSQDLGSELFGALFLRAVGRVRLRQKSLRHFRPPEIIRLEPWHNEYKNGSRALVNQKRRPLGRFYDGDGSGDRAHIGSRKRYIQ